MEVIDLIRPVNGSAGVGLDNAAVLSLEQVRSNVFETSALRGFRTCARGFTHGVRVSKARSQNAEIPLVVHLRQPYERRGAARRRQLLEVPAGKTCMHIPAGLRESRVCALDGAHASQGGARTR